MGIHKRLFIDAHEEVLAEMEEHGMPYDSMCEEDKATVDALVVTRATDKYAAMINQVYDNLADAIPNS